MIRLWKNQKYILALLFIFQGIFLFSESKGLFYEITSEKGTVYLLGSFHALRPEHYPLEPLLEEKFSDSDYLVLEANVGDDQSVEIIKLFARYGVYSGDETLKSELPRRLYQKARRFLKSYNTDINIYFKIKPWYLGMILSMMSIKKAGYSPELGLEQHFLGKNKDEEKKILELESIEFQISLFDNLSKEDQISYLESVLNESSQGIQLIDKLAAAWSIGDESTFETLFNSSYKGMEDEPFYKALFTNRNIGMAEKITGYLETDKTYFIIVGAGHVIGKTGVVQLLETAGYSVKQL